MQGFVVGFKSSKVFCLHYVSMQTLDIPQSSSLHNYVAKKGDPPDGAVTVSPPPWGSGARAAGWGGERR